MRVNKRDITFVHSITMSIASPLSRIPWRCWRFERWVVLPEFWEQLCDDDVQHDVAQLTEGKEKITTDPSPKAASHLTLQTYTQTHMLTHTNTCMHTYRHVHTHTLDTIHTTHVHTHTHLISAHIHIFINTRTYLHTINWYCPNVILYRSQPTERKPPCCMCHCHSQVSFPPD